jgi:hypothetical protein
LEFEKYIELKLGAEMTANKKQGKRRDKGLLKDILVTLFWARYSPNRSAYDIMEGLPKKYDGMNPDTLADNLEFLSKVPENKPFVLIMLESDGVNIYSLDGNTNPVGTVPLNTGHKPRNSYSVNPYYIKECFRNRIGGFYSLEASFS